MADLSTVPLGGDQVVGYGTGAPLVLLVQTHRYETYDTGSEDVVGGDAADVHSKTGGATESADPVGPGNVVEAADWLGRALAEHGIPAVHDRGYGVGAGTELPKGTNAYLASRARLVELLKRFPSVRLVIDVHRDALDHRRATGSLDGRPAAKLLWVVGSRPAKGDAPFGHGPADWWANLRAAGWMSEYLQTYGPDMFRGIWVKPGPYNQDLGVLSALIEIGGIGTRPPEAAASIPPLASAIRAYMLHAGLGGTPSGE